MKIVKLSGSISFILISFLLFPVDPTLVNLQVAKKNIMNYYESGHIQTI